MDMSFALFMDGDMGEQTGKLVTFIINMISMSLGFILHTPFYPRRYRISWLFSLPTRRTRTNPME